jgi:hypothetical protein
MENKMGGIQAGIVICKVAMRFERRPRFDIAGI